MTGLYHLFPFLFWLLCRGSLAAKHMAPLPGLLVEVLPCSNRRQSGCRTLLQELWPFSLPRMRIFGASIEPVCEGPDTAVRWGTSRIQTRIDREPSDSTFRSKRLLTEGRALPMTARDDAVSVLMKLPRCFRMIWWAFFRALSKRSAAPL